MTTLDELDLFTIPLTAATPTGARRRPHRHRWEDSPATGKWCAKCGTVRDAEKARRGRNNRKRGNGDEVAVAAILGGRRVGQLGLPWDVEVPGWLRLQVKKLVRWPPIASVVAWIDAIPQEPELRGVALADAPGSGGRVRRLVMFDLDEFAAWYAVKHGPTEEAA